MMPPMPIEASSTTKPANTLSTMWPASMLPNRRSPRLTGRDRNEITSITEMKGRITIGTPDGTKSLNQPRPCLVMPTMITSRITKTASVAVTTTWLVTVKK